MNGCLHMILTIFQSKEHLILKTKTTKRKYYEI
jgi:hypothetical protein